MQCLSSQRPLQKGKGAGELPGGPVVGTLLPLQGAQVQSLVGELRDLRELRSCKPLSGAKKRSGRSQNIQEVLC